MGSKNSRSAYRNGREERRRRRRKDEGDGRMGEGGGWREEEEEGGGGREEEEEGGREEEEEEGVTRFIRRKRKQFEKAVKEMWLLSVDAKDAIEFLPAEGYKITKTTVDNFTNFTVRTEEMNSDEHLNFPQNLPPKMMIDQMGKAWEEFEKQGWWQLSRGFDVEFERTKNKPLSFEKGHFIPCKLIIDDKTKVNAITKVGEIEQIQGYDDDVVLYKVKVTVFVSEHSYEESQGYYSFKEVIKRL